MRDAAGLPLYNPRTQAEAREFKIVVQANDGLRELVPHADGGWTAEPVTPAIYTQDSRPLAHMKPPMMDADLNTVVRLPGQKEGEQQWYILPSPPASLGFYPRHAHCLIPVQSGDPLGHNGRVFYGGANFGNHSVPSPNDESSVFGNSDATAALAAFMQDWNSSKTAT